MRTYLNVPYAQKNIVKKLGARWDGTRWYVENVENIAAFTQWMPTHLLRPSKPRKQPTRAR
jgi:hypothetical protein